MSIIFHTYNFRVCDEVFLYPLFYELLSAQSKKNK